MMHTMPTHSANDAIFDDTENDNQDGGSEDCMYYNSPISQIVSAVVLYLLDLCRGFIGISSSGSIVSGKASSERPFQNSALVDFTPINTDLPLNHNARIAQQGSAAQEPTSPPCAAVIIDMPVKVLNVGYSVLFAEATELLADRGAMVVLLARWRLLSKYFSVSLKSKVQIMVEEIIARCGQRGHGLYTDTITLAAMRVLLGTPYETTAPQRFTELNLAPICGLAVVVNPNERAIVRGIVSGAPNAQRALPLARSQATGSRRGATSIALCRRYERVALSPLLQPVRLLLDVAEPGGVREQTQSSEQVSMVQRMALRLRALEPAVNAAEHKGVLKGLVVESATSARLVVLVQNPWGDWECWATPHIETECALLACMCLAVLLEGHALLQALLRIDPETAATYHRQEEERIQWGKEVWRQTQIEVEATPNDSVSPRLLVPDVNHALYHLLTDDDYERRDA